MATIAITAPTGMIGSMLFNVLKERHQLVLITPDTGRLELLAKAYGDIGWYKTVSYSWLDLYQEYLAGWPAGDISPKAKELLETVGPVDLFVNCFTYVKAEIIKDPAAGFFVNGALPHILSRLYGNKLIHLSTDCVFSGHAGHPYTEAEPLSPTDIYGLTRSLGEPIRDSLVFRASIIGPEIDDPHLFVSWVQSQAGKEVKGFTKFLWNGLTSRQYGLIIDQIAQHRDQFPVSGVYHLFGSDISKYDMIIAIAKKYQIDVKLIPDAGDGLDRRFRTTKDMCDQLAIPAFEEMLTKL